MYYFRKIKNSKLLIIIIAIILIFSSLIISTIQDYTEFVKQQKSLEEQNNIKFDFALELDDKEREDILNKLFSDKRISVMIPGAQIRFEPGTFSVGMYLNNNDYSMPMLEGKFFDKEDFNNRDKEVVVGKEVLKSSIINLKDNEKYIKRGIEEYKVIGVIGNEKKRTYYDYHLFFKINNFSIDSIKNNTFVVTSNYMSVHEMEEILKEITLEKGKETFINVNITEKNDGTQDLFSRAVGIGGLYLIFYGSAFFCALLTYILSLINYINGVKNEIILRKVYGATKYDLLEEMVGRYVLISIIALVLSSVSSYIINKFSILNGSYINFKSISSIALFNIIVFIGIVFILINQIFINKVQSAEILKEK